jgi:hypothetical protein
MRTDKILPVKYYGITPNVKTRFFKDRLVFSEQYMLLVSTGSLGICSTKKCNNNPDHLP